MKRLFHGTTNVFYPPFKAKPTFFVGSFNYAYDHTDVQNDGKLIVLQCSLSDDAKLFDPRESKHRDRLRLVLDDEIEIRAYNSNKPSRLNRAFFLRMLELFTNDIWRLLEQREIIDALKLLGFDGHIAREDNEPTFCIYKPNKFITIDGYFGLMNIKEYDEIF